MKLVNKIDEKELFAARSTADAEGNNIIDTYAQKTEIPDVSNLATKDEISDMATESWVNNQDFAHTSEIPSIDGLMEESKLTIEDGKITKYDGTPFAGQGGGGGITASVDGVSVDSLEIITDHPGQDADPPTNPTINGEELRIYYADYANSSDYAYNANSADNAYHADYADNVSCADYADNANNATYATYATYDNYGNDIVDTYATKEEIPAIDGLMEESKLTIEDGKITEYDGTPFAGGGSGETVLWEGSTPATAGANLNVTLNLSESIKNFEYVVVFLTDENWPLGLCSPVLLDTNFPAAKKVISQGSSTTVYIGYLIQCSDTSLTYRCGFSNSFGTCYTGEYWGYGKPYKIVGINRKAGV